MHVLSATAVPVAKHVSLPTYKEGRLFWLTVLEGLFRLMKHYTMVEHMANEPKSKRGLVPNLPFEHKPHMT